LDRGGIEKPSKDVNRGAEKEEHIGYREEEEKGGEDGAGRQ
jgi:hypothetical protein